MIVLVIGLISAGLFASGQGEEQGSKQYKIVFNECFTQPHTLAEAANMFKEKVEAGSDGNVTVEVHYGGVPGTSREALEAVKIGTQTMVDAATAPIVAYDSAMGVLNLPYLFPADSNGNPQIRHSLSGITRTLRFYDPATVKVTFSPLH